MIRILNLPPALSPADFNEDGDVDVDDLGQFVVCAQGPAVLSLAQECERTDIDEDGDVDQDDFAIFQRCISGQNIPSDPTCGS